jgi:hypothetical protein
MRDDKNSFHYSVLPFDPDQPYDPRPPSPESQEIAFDDVINQLISKLAVAAKDRSDPLRPIRVLAACHSIVSSYTAEGFDMFAPFEHALKTDLHNALRMARRLFLRGMFLAPPHQSQDFLKVLREIGWRTSGEAGEDYDSVVEELFDGDYLRPSALAERKRRSNMA